MFAHLRDSHRLLRAADRWEKSVSPEYSVDMICPSEAYCSQLGKSVTTCFAPFFFLALDSLRNTLGLGMVMVVGGSGAWFASLALKS